jgi:hypothetical protein
MAKHYTASEFDQPKVCGLAIHNAKNRMAGAENEYQKALESSMIPAVCEVQSYCLYGVNPDCSVVTLSGQPTAADFARITKRTNLTALNKKYKFTFIGYVTCRRVNDKKQEWKTVSA